MAKGLCFQCGRGGHQIRDCPDAPKKEEKKKEEQFAKIRALVNDQTEEEKNLLINLMEQEAMDPVKLAGIAKWEPPKTVKGVHAFLGFGNFYQKFIGKYAQLARPLNDLTKKSQKFE
ncbi:reverse transcriptase-rnase h-integrase [Moniliophthora roreri MCA 2997]|uniref:Reverse transcriptase-rnase h-integrase n=1 Tax=Moniliophthora roreri (strain MCA 2997) TaxID=1381753 RepID=V2WRD0_MONRO|nr:reverse transcriptase-rnase h-integrase [Moniliophthora roreri MCA 2997]